jgi:hypothetical protein
LNGIHDNGLWNDWHCSDPIVPYICEIPDGWVKAATAILVWLWEKCT